MAGTEAGTKATVTALVANLFIAIAKFVAFAFTASASMLAESIHSVADTGNQALLLLGIRRARRTETPEHPFGFGRERYFWAFIVAIVLFTLGCLFSLFEGIEKLRHPHEVSSLGWAIGVLLFAMVFEAYALSVAVRQARLVKTGTWWSFIRNSRSPELPIVLLEDTGALLGLGFALTGIGAAAATGNPRFDALASLGIGALLGVIAIVLIVEMRSLLIGESATSADIEKIRAAMLADPDVHSLIHMRTQHLGPDELLVGAKVDLTDDLTFPQVAEVINRIESSVRTSVPSARVVYIEPDVARTTASP